MPGQTSFTASDAALGRQHRLVWGPNTVNAPPAGQGAGQPLVEGLAMGPGTYDIPIPIAGADAVTVILKPTTVTGACTANLYPALNDEVSADTSTTPQAITLTANTLAHGGGTGFGGARYAILRLFVPAAGALSFLGGIAEIRAY